ncbi:Cytosolic carboxypeptidase 1 [Bagarius yarrelli]|uniref:Cytosolic carboxypeptidase 1 n=1 Tax=Bagarius yarrelli TaxID=175774 RepID=A0A556VXH1_BAGYA|nr:Cytosolic carboxypeptidase 1 [Bagarius yarrelli]
MTRKHEELLVIPLAGAAVSAFAALLSSKENGRLAVVKGYISGLVSVYKDWQTQDSRREQDGTCLLMKDSEFLVESAVQLMRKCLPKLPVPLSSDRSTYNFPLPGNADEVWDSDPGPNDDLETDVNKLRARPDPDRSKEQFAQYEHFCPELHHNFQDLDKNPDLQDARSPQTFFDSCSSPSSSSPGEKQEEAELKVRDFLNCSLHHQETRDSVLDRLVEKYGASIPHHDSHLYRCAATHTKSLTTFSILAFPDFWGHLPPAGPERMANRT